MFNANHPVVENIIFLIILAFMGWYDHKKLMLEPWSLAFLVLMVIGNGNIWCSAMLLIIGYSIMFLSAIVGDFVCQRDSIAGGDMIISGVVCAYMGLKWFILSFIVAAVIGQIAVWAYYMHHRHLNIPYVPYLAAGAILGLIL